MSLATLDTLEVVKDLQSAGFTDAQAEAVARNIRKAQDLDLSTLATKADLEKVRTDLSAEIAQVRTELSAEIAQVRTDLGAEIAKVRLDLGADIAQLRTAMADIKGELAKWMFGAIGFQTVIILGAIVALLKLLKP